MKPTKRISKVWMFITLLILSLSTLRLGDVKIATDIVMCGSNIFCDSTLVALLIWLILNILLTILSYYCMIWTKFWIYRESK